VVVKKKEKDQTNVKKTPISWSAGWWPIFWASLENETGN